MKMKFLLLLGVFEIFVLGSCESHEKKVDDAFDRAREAKTNAKDTIIIDKKQEKASAVTKTIVRTENIDMWTKFRSETEQRIKANENKIIALKENKEGHDNQSTFNRQITQLEQKNNNLRKTMNDYYEDAKAKWEKFKVGMNHDIDEIGIELKDVTINNRKLK